MWRHAPIHIGLVILIALAAIFFMRVRGAGGVTPAVTSVSEIARGAHAPNGGDKSDPCHCEEPSDEAIQTLYAGPAGLLRWRSQ